MNVTPRLTLIIAILVLFLGKYINKKLVFLRDFNIPEPVTGGVLTSIAFGLIYWLFGIQFEFALEMRDSLLLVFFTTIGLSSKVKTLISGGKPLLILMVASITYLISRSSSTIALVTACHYYFFCYLRDFSAHGKNLRCSSYRRRLCGSGLGCYSNCYCQHDRNN